MHVYERDLHMCMKETHACDMNGIQVCTFNFDSLQKDSLIIPLLLTFLKISINE